MDKRNYPGPAEPGVLPDDEWQQLRQLLLAHEIDAIDKLQKRLNDQNTHARELSNVVAEAILLRSQKDESLQTALQDTVDKILSNNLRRNPVDVANHIFPVIGPAIRRSIAEVFRSMLQGFNKSLELSLSWKGLRWRLEALRTGKPFSEIVLLNTLVYRVEQVFLVHTETGIMLDHVVGEGIQSQDADLVSGMLTAVQQFVSDSFGHGQNDRLESLQMGEISVLVARNPQAYLACVVRGNPPANLVQQMHTALEFICLECAEGLNNFDGDTSKFQMARRYLENLLVSRFIDEDKKLPLYIRLLPVAIVLFIIGGFAFLKYREGVYLNAITSLNQQPGIVLTDVEYSMWSTPWKVFVLRDDLASDPANTLQQAGMPADKFVMHAFPIVSLDESIVQARVAQAINPPPEVSIRFDEKNVLHLKGQAPMGWIIAAREKALATPGVKGVDTSQLVDPRHQELNKLLMQINGVSILFVLNKDMPLPEEAPKLKAVVDDLVALEKLAEQMNMGVTLTIYGHADSTGSDKRNYEISQERAKTIAALLYAKGSSIPISIYGMGADYASRPDGHAVADANSRKIELRVHLVRLPADRTDDFL